MPLRENSADRIASVDISFMRRLREDVRGNTLAIFAAAMIPLFGLIGSGVDISRAYLVKSRVQQACDAGVLGGRKVMGASGVDAQVIAETKKFVDYNFAQNTMGTSAFTVTPTLGTGNAVNLTLSTNLPTSIMKIFGVSSLAVSASCTARQDFVNTDVMLVLDTTLSMNCLPSESATTLCTSEKSGSKIQALRSAVTSFYNALKPAQTQLESQGLRLRYGIVPYSSTVNAGALLQPNGWVNLTSNYRNCTTRSGGSPSTCTTAGAPYAVTHDATFMASWPGCIEERQTVATINGSSGYTPPVAAYDLDVSTIPSSTATRWNVYDPAAEGAKGSSSATQLYNACPTAMRNISAVSDVSAMNTYTSGLVAGGYTYHDLGLLWGARMLAPSGLWASNNPSTFNGFPVNRDLIFMTDGALDPDLDHYSAYGVEKFDKRVSGNGSTANQDASHLQRFRMLCNSVKGMNVRVWVIAFGTSAGTGLSADLINCATSPAQAFKADDQATLIAKFTEIGQAIGALRLSQ